MLVKQFTFKRIHDKGGYRWIAESTIERPDFHRGRPDSFRREGFAALVRLCQRTGTLEHLSEMHPPDFDRRMQTTWGGDWYPHKRVNIC
jgi:hypothetical protein